MVASTGPAPERLPATPEEALAFLHSLTPSGIHLGLDRMARGLEALGHPERRYPSLQVAGTNGKGSTCAMVAACLRAQGHRVGLYSSPHLVRVNERFQVDGEPIADEVLGRRVLELLERHPEGVAPPSPLTFFEFGTLLALWHFAEEQVDVAVLEVGLGGRLDATTAVTPVLTAITPVSFDHVEFLGNTYEAIAREKAGICKPGVPVVVSRQHPEAFAAIERVAAEVGAPVSLQGRDFDVEPEPAGTLRFSSGKMVVGGLELGLRGEHQRTNAAVAVECLRRLGQVGLVVSQEALRRGLKEAVWPGRLEEVAQSPTVVLDGAHNPAGAEVLARALDTLYAGRSIHLVFGVLADKDYLPVAKTLFPRCASVHLTPVASPRSLSPERLLEVAQSCAPEVTVHADAAQALAGAKARALSDGEGKGMVLGAGSLFLVGELKALLGTSPSPPRSPRA